MLAMQYSIQLPPDYGAEQVQARVDARKNLFDACDGLLHKSFLYNHEDQLYAPFYVWQNVVEAQNFLLNELFRGVTDSFSRCRVRSWFSTHMQYANREIVPSFACREVDKIAAEVRLDKFLQAEKEHQDTLLADKNLYMHLVAFDAERWEIMRFSLWKDSESAQKPSSDSFIEYDVLHITEPKIA